MKTYEQKIKEYQNGKTATEKARIMVVAGNSLLRSELVEIIENRSNLQVCAQASNVGQVLEAFGKRPVDFTIICTFSGDPESNALVNEIKFGCPNLPVLMLAMPAEMIVSSHSFRQKGKGIINQYAAEQIIDAVYYVENLLQNSILGFAVLVNISLEKAAVGIDQPNDLI